MEVLVDAGKTRAIGVSNFRIEDLKKLELARIKPIVNQIEYHVYLQQPELIEFMQERVGCLRLSSSYSL
jgi:diketogulonate reductase-like aldo/keto reductase